jgi:hypothetical protein
MVSRAHPPQQPPEKVIFFQFAGEVRHDDPRLLQFTESLKQLILNPPNGVDPTKLEFEAKLGKLTSNPSYPSCILQINNQN